MYAFNKNRKWKETFNSDAFNDHVAWWKSPYTKGFSDPSSYTGLAHVRTHTKLQWTVEEAQATGEWYGEQACWITLPISLIGYTKKGLDVKALLNKKEEWRLTGGHWLVETCNWIYISKYFYSTQYFLQFGFRKFCSVCMYVCMSMRIINNNKQKIST